MLIDCILHTVNCIPESFVIPSSLYAGEGERDGRDGYDNYFLHCQHLEPYILRAERVTEKSSPEPSPSTPQPATALAHVLEGIEATNW
jgi:hypothetical protein